MEVEYLDHLKLVFNNIGLDHLINNEINTGSTDGRRQQQIHNTIGPQNVSVLKGYIGMGLWEGRFD
jgi:hypothetical protein